MTTGRTGLRYAARAGSRGPGQAGPLLPLVRGLIAVDADPGARGEALVRDLLLRDPGSVLPTAPRVRAGGSALGCLRPALGLDPPALDQGLPADLWLPVVA